MKRVYIPYWDWEDWNHGMWRKVQDEKLWLEKAIEFMGDHIMYGAAMIDVVIAWPNTMLNNLTNPSMNKLAFIGHCACCYEFGCPEYVVRMAWKELTNEQRELANDQARTVLNIWIDENENN